MNQGEQHWPTFLPRDVIFESFTFPFFDLNYKIDHVRTAEAFLAEPDTLTSKGQRGLYIHIPFCETICSFCPFDKSVGTEEQIDTYIRALYREIELVSSKPLVKSWAFDAIYFGGGTPSLLGPARSSKLIDVLRRAFRIKTDAEVTFETEPKSSTKDLFLALSDAGVNRVSFGVQTFDAELRAMMNLTASFRDIERTIEIAIQNFKNTNFDMIVGFPGQGSDHAARDVDLAARTGIGSISVYPMDYITVLPAVLEQIRRGDIPSPAVGRERWRVFQAARKSLQRHFFAQNMYCFGTPEAPKCRYMFDILYGGYHDQCIGLGRGAYTVLRGLIYKNSQLERDYLAALKLGNLPVQIASPGHAYEKSFVYFPKRLSADLSEAVELGIEHNITKKAQELEQSGLVTTVGQTIKLTNEGEEVYAQMMVAFLSDNQRRLYDRASKRLQGQLNWGEDGTIDTTKPVARGLGLGARNALSK